MSVDGRKLADKVRFEPEQGLEKGTNGDKIERPFVQTPTQFIANTP